MTHNFRNPPPFRGHAPAEGRGLVFLVAVRRNSISPVSHQNDLLQRMGIMLMTPDEAAGYPPGRAVGPLPPMPAPQPPTLLTPGDRRFLPRRVQGEILGSRSPSDFRINELGEGRSSNMTILSEGLNG
jgi:hypothetical protein